MNRRRFFKFLGVLSLLPVLGRFLPKQQPWHHIAVIRKDNQSYATFDGTYYAVPDPVSDDFKFEAKDYTIDFWVKSKSKAFADISENDLVYLINNMEKP